MSRKTTLSDRTLLVGAIVLAVIGFLLDLFDAPQWAIELTRAIVLIGATYIVVASVIIARVYWRNFKIAPEKARLLPRHVVQLGVLVALLTIHVAAYLIALVGQPVVWFAAPILLPAMFVGVFGLHDMLTWLPDRRKDLKPTGEQR